MLTKETLDRKANIFKAEICYLNDVIWSCFGVITHQTVVGFSRHLKDILKTCFEDIFKTSWRETKCLLGISVSNKSKCVSNKSIFHKSISGESKVNPIRTQ